MSRYPPPGMRGPDAIARWALATRAGDVRVEGVEHVPPRGGVLLVAHHVHHLLDGAVIVRRTPRPVHVVVALDWTAGTLQRRIMERACALAGWPTIVRGDGFASRRGLRAAARLLAEGRVVAIFPEGWPVVDPAGDAPRTRDEDGFLPFAAGYRTVLRLARAHARVALVPLGFRYARSGARWNVVARFGPPRFGEHDSDVEAAVRALSA